MAYAELHAHSNFSFLDGASHPEELAAEAVRLGLSALALTDHNGLYGVVRFAEAARAFGLPTVFGAELTITGAGTARRPHRGARPGRHPPGRAGPGPRGLRPPQPGHRRGPPGRRGEGEADHHPRRPVRPPRRALAGPHRVPQGGAGHRPHHRGPGGGGPDARPPDRAVRPRPPGRRAVGPRQSDRRHPQRRPGPAGHRAGGGPGGHQQRALRHPGPVPPGHRAGRGTGPADPGRPRRVAPLLGHRLPAGGGRAAPAVRPVARGGRPGRRAGRRVRLRPAPGGPPAPRLSGARRAHRADLAGRAGPPGGHRPVRAPGGRAGAGGLGPARPRAGHHRRARVPRLLPHRLGHRRLLPAAGHLLPGPGLGGHLGGLLRPRHHQRRRRLPRAAVRALPLPGPRRAARHRRRHRVGPARGGHPVRLRALRPAARRPGGQRHHLPVPLGPARHGQGPRAPGRGGGRLVEVGRPGRAARRTGATSRRW